MLLKKIVNFYKSPSVAINIVKKKPYKLVEIIGYSFNKADELAMQGDLSMTSLERLRAYIIFLLTDASKKGFSYLESYILVDYIDENLGCFTINDITEVINQLKEEKILIKGYSGIVALSKVFNLEKNIANELKRILDGESKLNKDKNVADEVITGIEYRQGFNFSNEQRNGMHFIMDNQITMVSGKAGCVDCDTEYFDGKVWKKISRYVEGDEVFQYNPRTDRVYGVLPEKYHVYKLREDEHLWKMESRNGQVNQVLSDEHNFMHVYKNGHVHTKPFADIRKAHEKSSRGYHGRIKNNFCYDGVGIDMTDDEIRASIQISKKSFRFQVRLYKCSQRQLLIVADELNRWDNFGRVKKNKDRFTTAKSSNANFIQFVFSSLGHTANILSYKVKPTYHKKHIKLKNHYVVLISKYKNKTTSLRGRTPENKVKIVPYTEHDGYKYCFTVDSGILVLRRNGRIFITGNSGKTTIAEASVKALGDVDNNGLCALSGKASSNLGNYVGRQAKTIHRLLKFNPKGWHDLPKDKNGRIQKFKYNTNNKLPYSSLIIDEYSMVSDYILLKLLEACGTGIKLIFLGDTNQLSSINSCPVGKEMLDSKLIPKYELTKIYRQKEGSSLKEASIKVSEGEQLFSNTYNGIETHGELQDFTTDIDILESNEDKLTGDKAFEYYKQFLESNNYNLKETIILTPMKTRGKSSVFILNNKIQDWLNPIPFISDTCGVEIEIPCSIDNKNKYQFSLRKNDRVILLKNNYDTVEVELINGSWQTIYKPELMDIFRPSQRDKNLNTDAVFNGFVGTLEDCTLGKDGEFNSLIVYIEDLNRYISLPRKYWHTEKGVKRAYALGIYKSQGSQYDNVVVCLDNSHYNLLTKELLYVAISRAKLDCVLVGENSAVRHAIKNSDVRDTQAFLKYFIDDGNIDELMYEINGDDEDKEDGE